VSRAKAAWLMSARTRNAAKSVCERIGPQSRRHHPRRQLLIAQEAAACARPPPGGARDSGKGATRGQTTRSSTLLAS
jgi:hypothetical protein